MIFRWIRMRCLFLDPRPMSAISVAALVLMLELSPRTSAAAPSGPTTVSDGYSAYERAILKEAEAQLGSVVDESPEGKTVESVEALPLEVLESRDLPSGFLQRLRALNALHVTTKKRQLLREALLTKGDRYQKVLADETARNLRKLPQLSTVLVVPLRGTKPGSVRLLLVAKDVWSLRLAWDAKFGPGGFESFLAEPSERNFLGLHQTLLARVTYNPGAWSLGFGYREPRLEGRWLALVADANVIVNKHTGELEGSFGGASLSRPLYSTQTEWAYSTGVAWRDDVVRRFVNAELAYFDGDSSPGKSGVPWVYHGRRLTAQASVTRSFGWANKFDINVGAEMNRRTYNVGDVTRYDPTLVRSFLADWVPVGETRVGPFVQLHAYSNRYLRTHDVETLALQEDFRLGHDVWGRAYVAPKEFGATRGVVGGYVGAQYTVAMGNGFARVGADVSVEGSTGGISDGAVTADLRLVSPRMLLGRFVYDVTALHRFANHLNRTVYMGGDTRLRGYPSNFFAGRDSFAQNFEFRSRPLSLWSAQLSGVAFYDAAGAFESLDRPRIYHSVGTGFRVLFPSLDRVVFRGDLGIPIQAGGAPKGVAPVSFFVAFEQAFGPPTVGGRAGASAYGTAPGLAGALGQ